MKHFLAAIALVCALSVSAFAGDIPMTVTAPAPPPDETATPGEMPTAGVTSSGDMPTIDQFLLTVLGLVF